MHRDGRYGSCRSLSPPFAKQDDYKRYGARCQVAWRFESFSSHERQRCLTRIFAKPNQLLAFMQTRAGIELQNASNAFSDIG